MFFIVFSAAVFLDYFSLFEPPPCPLRRRGSFGHFMCVPVSAVIGQRSVSSGHFVAVSLRLFFCFFPPDFARFGGHLDLVFDVLRSVFMIFG